eukprot:3936447-Rhodomonas_salina.1
MTARKQAPPRTSQDAKTTGAQPRKESTRLLTGAVDEARDVAVEVDEVEVEGRSLDVHRVLLGGVAERVDLLLAVLGVVVEADLGVHAADLARRRLHERVLCSFCSVVKVVQLLVGLVSEVTFVRRDCLFELFLA